jgi:transcriptional regulator with GAF, ATPase, and Fis domain
MNPAGEGLSDSNFAALLLLEVAHEQSLEQLLEKIVTRSLQRPNFAAVQLWLVRKGDRCPKCPQKGVCPDQTRCLHLAAGGGNAVTDPQGELLHFDDPELRTPLGVGLVGSAAAEGRELVVADVDNEPRDAFGMRWLRKWQVRAFAAMPIVFKGEVLGVAVGFMRSPLDAEGPRWGRIFADHIGGAISHARAFEEIQLLKAQLEMRNAYLEEEVLEAKAFGELVGQSAPLRQIISQIDLVASTDASVLILGATGTGKELVAREIHRRSNRRDKPLVRVNCASIPKDLFESEFFGHVKGAFTGAVKDRSGRFETAEGGTLFLDEIAEVPRDLQSKLLRVLQEKRYERVGDDRTRQADVRIIAATNQDLKAEVAKGRFREDLYYRLSVFPIHVPALRERKEDIPLLAKHFVEVSVKELRCPKPRLTRAGLEQLKAYDWPGNIRELRNVIERAVILARGGPLEFQLPLEGYSGATPVTKHPDPNQGDVEIFTEVELRQRERANLRAALNKTGWKIKGPDGASELLGVKPTTLLFRIRKMGLKRH